MNRLDESIFMAVPKLMLTDFGIHYRLESCVQFLSDPCSDVYQGIGGDSEPETNAVVNSIKEHSANLKSAIAIHR